MSNFVATAQHITSEGAQAAIAASVAEAQKQGWAFSIAVTDTSGDLLAFYRMEGAARVSGDAAILKARTTARFGAPSRKLHEMLDAGNLAVLTLPGVAPLGGGVPILYGKKMIGAIGVSGGALEDDIQVAKAGAAAAIA